MHHFQPVRLALEELPETPKLSAWVAARAWSQTSGCFAGYYVMQRRHRLQN